MMLTKSLPRRTVLRGLGATLALPFLDAMAPAARAAGSPPHRFQSFYVPNGMAMEYWTPPDVGTNFTMTPVLEPLAPFRDQLIVVSGLNAVASNGGVHASAATRFLTGVRPSRSENNLRASVSIDQLIAGF